MAGPRCRPRSSVPTSRRSGNVGAQHLIITRPMRATSRRSAISSIAYCGRAICSHWDFFSLLAATHPNVIVGARALVAAGRVALIIWERGSALAEGLGRNRHGSDDRAPLRLRFPSMSCRRLSTMLGCPKRLIRRRTISATCSRSARSCATIRCWELRRLETCGRCYAAGSLRAAMSIMNPTHPQ